MNDRSRELMMIDDGQDMSRDLCWLYTVNVHDVSGRFMMFLNVGS